MTKQVLHGFYPLNLSFGLIGCVCAQQRVRVNIAIVMLAESCIAQPLGSLDLPQRQDGGSQPARREPRGTRQAAQ